MRISDWSSDVCSSDLQCLGGFAPTFLNGLVRPRADLGIESGQRLAELWDFGLDGLFDRAETGACGFRRIEIDNRGSSFIDTDLRLGKRGCKFVKPAPPDRSEEHTSEIQSLMRIASYVFCLK